MPQEPAALSCHGLTKRYDDVLAVDDLDLLVRPGECFGLLGPNGAGKTTTVEILLGLTPPSEGRLAVLGADTTSGIPRAVQDRVGVQLQETQLQPKLTVQETVRLFRSFYRGGPGVDDLIALVGLAEKRSARVGKLSGGQRQRLALACALAGDPELLFLDEPSTGLDPQARLKVWEIVEAFRSRGGTVLLTTHYMEEAERLCDRVGILDHGRIIALGTPAELIASLGAGQVVEIRVRGELPPGALEQLPGASHVVPRDGAFRMTVANTADALQSLLGELERRAVLLDTLAIHRPTLEDVFVSLTGRELRDG